MQVPVTTNPAFSLGTAAPLERAFFNTAGSVERSFDLMPDGTHIISLRETPDDNGHTVAPEIRIVVNWFEELKARLPAGR
jgi:hypothetical protein